MCCQIIRGPSVRECFVERLVLIMPKGRIEILKEYCKSCSLCVDACPKKVLKISDKINSKGHRYVEQAGDDCIGCGICAVRCPDAVIEVYREA